MKIELSVLVFEDLKATVSVTFTLLNYESKALVYYFLISGIEAVAPSPHQHRTHAPRLCSSSRWWRP